MPEDTLPSFYCALARQCFINEYVFATTDDEAEEARHLRAALEQKLSSGEPYPLLWPAAVGAYCPLHILENAQALLDRTAPPSIAALLAQQVAEPAEEKRLAAAIPALTEISGEVSSAVRQQYEENPYPRWTKLGPAAQPAALFALPEQQSGDALIAGCGTGLSTVEFARHARNTRILAVDLSVSSLSYAKRMADQVGLANVEFAQADIMKFGAFDRQFDFIDASGVLHHLADPWARLADSALAAAARWRNAGRALQRTGTPRNRRGTRADRRARLPTHCGRTSGAAAPTSSPPRIRF